jgi:hypothetical protein
MPFIYFDVIDDERIFVPISEIQLVNETFEDLTARIAWAYDKQ